MSTGNSNSASPLAWLTANRGTAGAGLIVLGALLGAVPATLAAKMGSDFILVTILSGALALLVLCLGVVIRYLPTSAGYGQTAEDLLRIFVLVLGGVSGLLIALIGVALQYQWWNDLTRWLRLGERDGAWHVLVALAVLLSGLALMFVSLQIVRSVERTSAVLRRLVYGYNAVLTGVLLLLILAVANVLVSLKYSGAIDATQSGKYTLSERAVNVLKGLDRPVQVFVLWPDDDTMDPLRSLLGNMEDSAKDLKVRYVSPGLEPEKIAELIRKYPRKIEERLGVLIVNGEEKPENATFLKETDLFSSEGFGPSATVKFRGEDKIIAALSSSGAKTVVYVTQGQGEPDLDDAGRQLDQGLSVLKERLTARGNFDVKRLKFNVADPKVPDDCNVLIVANPRPPLDGNIERAVRSYLVERKGKAIIMVDVPSENARGDKKDLPATGLEELLGQFNVELPNQRIVSVLFTQGGTARVTDGGLFEISPDLAKSPNELSKAFASESFQLRSTRVIRPNPAGGNPTLRAEPLLVTMAGMLSWAEGDMQADLIQKANMVLTNKAEAERLVSKAPLAAAVMVTESAPSPPPSMGAPPPSTAKPRMIVLGDATLATNAIVALPPNFSFLASAIDWLAERTSSIGIESKELPVYLMDAGAAEKAASRLVWLPVLLSLVGIIGLGAGVWVVRRR